MRNAGYHMTSTKFYCVHCASFREACEIRSLVHGFSSIIPKFPHYCSPSRTGSITRLAVYKQYELSDALGTIAIIFFECIYALAHVHEV